MKKSYDAMFNTNNPNVLEVRLIKYSLPISTASSRSVTDVLGAISPIINSAVVAQLGGIILHVGAHSKGQQ
jgi:hypothetical protein